MNREALKRQARLALGGGIFTTPWLMALIVCVIVGAIAGLSASVSLSTNNPIHFDFTDLAGREIHLINSPDN